MTSFDFERDLQKNLRCTRKPHEPRFDEFVYKDSRIFLAPDFLLDPEKDSISNESVGGEGARDGKLW